MAQYDYIHIFHISCIYALMALNDKLCITAVLFLYQFCYFLYCILPSILNRKENHLKYYIHFLIVASWNLRSFRHISGKTTRFLIWGTSSPKCLRTFCKLISSIGIMPECRNSSFSHFSPRCNPIPFRWYSHNSSQ